MQRALSPHDQASLLARVEGLLAGSNIPRDTLRRAVFEVCSALETAGPLEGGGVLMVATATSVPDLASRVRAHLAAAGVVPVDMGAATTGRHAVVTLQVGSAERETAERALQQAGVTVHVADDIPGGGT